MKHATLVALGILAAHTSYGQKTEYSIHLNSGGSAYRGASVGYNSVFTISDTGAIPFYTNSPYGRKLGFSYGLAAQAQRVTPAQNVFGMQAGYEELRNRSAITAIEGFRFQAPASGHSKVTNQAINVHPFFGHRFALKAIALDLTAGPEVGFIRRSYKEQYVVDTAGDILFDTSQSSHGQPNIDLRARVNLAAYYKHLGLTLGYSRGLTNYYDGYGSSAYKVYAQVFRVGLAYRI